MNLIVAVDKNWGIGKDNKLLAHIPEDMKFFKKMTTGKVVVMGRKTLESFPGKRPLKNRTNIVLSHDSNYKVDPAVVVHSEEELDAVLEKYDTDDVYVIGGGNIYRMLLNRCKKAFITYICHRYEADTYFPDLDKNPEWILKEESEMKSYVCPDSSQEDIHYYFRRYYRKDNHDYKE